MAALGPFEPYPRIAVAVSGGGDSMALLHLLHEWTSGEGGHAIALTVDHRLRPEAADEARQVAAWCAALGCEHVTLTWRDPPAAGSALQEQARAARYRLLDEACRDRGILHLATAHHRDDQAETLLLRLGQGSGVDGLAGMAPIVELAHARLIRPLLCHDGAEVKSVCRAHGQAWIEDPSNVSPRFARARLRAAMASFAAQGMDVASLVQTGARMAQVRAMLEAQVAAFLARHASIDGTGLAVDIAAFRTLPLEMRQRCLGEMARAVGGLDYLPRFAKLQVACAAIDQPCFKRTTLGHCLVARHRAQLRIEPEGRPGEPETKSGQAAAKAIFAIV